MATLFPNSSHAVPSAMISIVAVPSVQGLNLAQEAQQNSRLVRMFVQHVKKKQRVKVMEYWIETARECFNIGNFNSLMAIIAGLNMSPISRLKKTVSNSTQRVYHKK
uniref:Ras-GEF domain-containing protein n=1 Tax=Timema tahoe TaxID=61484 RepID=A0A7R9ICS1_9NEOP|nr:unnamed protein product [Timema tahoe]